MAYLFRVRPMRILMALLLLLALIVGVSVITARLGLWPVAATSRPSQLESELGQSSLSASLSRQASGLTNPVQPSNDVLIAGQKMFKMNCAGCHGTPGQPSQWGTHNFYPRVPQFGDQPPKLTAAQM